MEVFSVENDIIIIECIFYICIIFFLFFIALKCLVGRDRECFLCFINSMLYNQHIYTSHYYLWQSLGLGAL